MFYPLVILLLVSISWRLANAAYSDSTRAVFRKYITNVTAADGYVYGVRDNLGYTMDTVKIIRDTVSGTYLGVYHVYLSDNNYHVWVSQSTDLIHWTFKADLGTLASQPCIFQTADNGFLVAWEQCNLPNKDGNHVKISYYPSLSSLFGAAPTRTFDTPMSLSKCAEGTPNIYSAVMYANIDSSVINIGFHYNQNCQYDREGRGTLTNFNNWTASAQPLVDNAFLYWGVQGNIGDRDAVTFGDFNYGLFEGEYTPNTFASFRTFCYDYQTANSDTLSIITHGGSVAFANPTVTRLNGPNGQKALVVTYFLPGEGAAPGEGGPLIFYKYINECQSGI